MRTPAFVAAIVLASGAALAQNRLDRPLDRNLQRGSGGRNPAGPNFRDELRLRNAIVTGNAVGGLSFRGDVGYVAPGEFFGRLGTNDSFAFRRDSFYSGLGGMGIRGTDAIQYQMAMTTGNSPPPGFAGAPVLSRSVAGVSGDTIKTRMTNAIGENGVLRAQTDRDELASDLRNMNLLSIRSPAAFVATRNLEPTVVGRVNTAEGSMGVSASPLRGLTYDSSPLKAPSPKTPRQPAEPRPGTPPSTTERLTEDPRAAAAASGLRSDNKLDNAAPQSVSAYDQLMDRIRGGDKPDEAAKDPAALAAGWQTQLDELRNQLGADPRRARSEEGRDKAPQPKIDENKPPAGRPDARPGDARPGDTKPGEVKPPGPALMPGERPGEDLRPETIERIRKAGAKVEKLAPPGFDAYSTHMQAAQEHIAAGRFFFAEERFTAALTIKAGDPMAAIGRIHSQLGAGMFLSAEINLRVLFTEHPEMVSLKYKPELLPSPERMKLLIDRLTELTGAKDGRRRETAFLLAYVGFQAGDTKAMKNGLDIMAEAPEVAEGQKPPETPDQLQKLATLLTKVWLAPPAPAEAPKAEPAKPEPAPAPPK